MRTFLHIVLAASLFVLNTKGVRSEEKTNATVSIPVGKLAFVTSEDFGTAGKIYVVSGRHVSTTQAYETRELELLPDGRRIIYCASDSKAQGIYIYDLEEQANTLLLTNIPSAESPSLLRDGSKLAFVVSQAGQKSSQIFTADVKGSDVKQLTEGQYYNWNPRWSPDGKRLVFETTRNDNPDNHVKNGGHRDIYLMDSDGQIKSILPAALMVILHHGHRMGSSSRTWRVEACGS